MTDDNGAAAGPAVCGCGQDLDDTRLSSCPRCGCQTARVA
ncbi:hypothetical protein ABIE44_003720 [Marmoricola sp. OAE513]